MRGQLELRQLGSFVVAAEELHFTRAAHRLHLTQQALSTQIRHLERSLGVQLFWRTTRHVELTEAGRTLLEHAVPLLEAADRAWEAVARTSAGDVGHIVMSYAPTLRRTMLPLLLTEFQRRYPNVELRSREVLSADMSLRDGPVDVIVARFRPPTSKDVASIPILHSPLGVMLGRDHPQAQGATADITQLQDQALKIWPREFSPEFYDTIVSSLRSAGFMGPIEELEIFGSRILMEDSAACEKIAAGRAFGIGFEGQYTALAPELVWRPIAPTLPIPMHLSWRRHCSRAVRNLITVMLEVASAQRWLPDERRAEAERLLVA